MKKTNNGSTTSYEFDSVSEQSQIVVKHIIDGLIEANVAPQDVMPILADSCIRFLVAISEDVGYDRNEIAKVFGEGIANVKLEFED
jgi:hypothetical protein